MTKLKTTDLTRRFMGLVAVNKVDKPEANPERVKKQLADRGLIPEEWAAGSEGTVFVEVSAKKRLNLDLLLEMICLVSDIKAPKAMPGRKAVGSVLEAKLDRGRGSVATVLVQDGTLKLNDSYIVGNTFGKVRAMFDDRGRAIVEAGPSTPVEVLGLDVQAAGDVIPDRLQPPQLIVIELHPRRLLPVQPLPEALPHDLGHGHQRLPR